MGAGGGVGGGGRVPAESPLVQGRQPWGLVGGVPGAQPLVPGQGSKGGLCTCWGGSSMGYIAALRWPTKVGPGPGEE